MSVPWEACPSSAQKASMSQVRSNLLSGCGMRAVISAVRDIH